MPLVALTFLKLFECRENFYARGLNVDFIPLVLMANSCKFVRYTQSCANVILRHMDSQ
jgi:hypothetical protein